VTLTGTEPEAGYNYFVAAIQDAAGRTGNVSPKIILKLQNAITSGPVARVNVYPNGSVNNSSTSTTGSFHVINQSTGGEGITSVTIHLPGSLLPDIVFDPTGGAGDTAGKAFTADSGGAATGLSGHSFTGPHDGGFDSLTINFTDFNPGETFTFSVDVDPTSIQGAVPPGPQQSGSISGLEASGATITVQFSDGSTRSGELFVAAGSKVNSHVILDEAAPVAPTLEMLGVANTPTIVTNSSQTIRISGPQGATARLLQTEGALFLGGVPGEGFDIDPFETNKVIFVTHASFTIGSAGFVDVPVLLNDSHERGGVNTFVAVIQDLDGRTSMLSNAVVVALNDDPAASSVDFTGLLAGDYDGSGTVGNWDYMAWKRTFGEIGDGMLTDGSGNGVIDAADYVVWRKHFGQSLTPSASSGTIASFQTQSNAESVATGVAVETADHHSASTSVRNTSHVADPRITTGLPKTPPLKLASRLAKIAAVQSRALDLLMLNLELPAVARAKALTISDLDIDELISSESEHEEFARNAAFESFDRNVGPFDS
jgi:hypothetical protein